jgi:AcrR family transcriptional regulator
MDTKETLLESGIYLFSQNGFEGTSTRMIADYCSINVATIAFHFGNKEGFYNAVMHHAAAKMDKNFRPFSKKVTQYLSHQTSEEKTWELVEAFVDLIIDIVRDRSQSTMLNLLIREQTNPPDGNYPLTAVVFKQSETILTNLMQNLNPKINHSTIAIHSRLILGGLISQGEHPLFIRRALDLKDDAELTDDILREIRTFTLDCIRTGIHLNL